MRHDSKQVRPIRQRRKLKMAETEEPKKCAEEENDLVSKIKKELEGWREVLLPLNKMLTWEKPHYPAILVGIISFIFILIWYLEPSVLTTFSLIGFHVCLIDYLVPTVATNLFRSTSWTGVQEREFENICIRIHNAKVHFHNLRQGLGNLKRDKPKTYFVAVMSSLAMLAWIGNLLNNLLLTYLIILFVVLLPGLRHRGIMQRYTHQLKDAVKGIVQSKKKKN